MGLFSSSYRMSLEAVVIISVYCIAYRFAFYGPIDLFQAMPHAKSSVAQEERIISDKTLSIIRNSSEVVLASLKSQKSELIRCLSSTVGLSIQDEATSSPNQEMKKWATSLRPTGLYGQTFCTHRRTSIPLPSIPSV